MKAFLDANVLYPTSIRDLFIEFAIGDLILIRWSALNTMLNRYTNPKRTINELKEKLKNLGLSKTAKLI
jgi:hypothetical protein